MKLSEGDDYGFSYTEAGGASHNIWFTSADGATVYPHEIDKWDTSGDSFVWVRLPELKKGTTFKMHWSDNAGDVQSASGNVWDGFVGVWHMNATGTTAEPDSTVNNLSATPYITSGMANINSDANGKVGSGRANIANANLRVSNYSGNLTSSTKFTMSGWMKLSAKGSWPRIFVGNPSNGDRSCWEIWRESDSQVKVNGGNSSTTATFNLGLGTGTWYYLTLVYDGTSVTLYSNGNSQGSGTVATPAHKTYLSIGGPGTTADRSIVGTFDEVRMYNGALSAERVAADYATMNDPRRSSRLPLPRRRPRSRTAGRSTPTATTTPIRSRALPLQVSSVTMGAVKHKAASSFSRAVEAGKVHSVSARTFSVRATRRSRYGRAMTP